MKREPKDAKPRRGLVTRRNILRGAGVALALPWLETLAPRPARGESTLARRRFVAMYFPCGVSNFWTPSGTGAGAAWQLSPILQPLAPFKSQVSVLSNVGNYSPWGRHIEPSHSNLTGAFLSCTAASGSNSSDGNISVDQVIANGIGAATRVPSLQVGLSTLDSYTDGLPAQHSRSISWASPMKPLFKLIDPQMVFDKLFGVMGPALPDTRPADKSVLDLVLAQATSLQLTLSRSDRTRVDEFLTSVRDVEKNIAAQGSSQACSTFPRPTQSISVGNVPAGYDRNAHADLMIDLVTLALQCDVTRVVSFMLDDSRSDFVYSFLSPRTFTTAGSVPAGGEPLGGLHGLSSSGDSNSAWATANLWFVEKLTRMCQKMAAVQDGTGGNVLDQSVVWFGSEMHGGNHDGLDLPVLYVGGAGGRLKTDQHLDFIGRPRMSEDLANVYLTFLKKAFDLPETKFGMGRGDFGDAGTKIIPELLA